MCVYYNSNQGAWRAGEKHLQGKLACINFPKFPADQFDQPALRGVRAPRRTAWMAARASAPDNRRIAEKLAAVDLPAPERRATQDRVGGEGDHRRRRQEADVPDPCHGVRRGHHRPCAEHVRQLEGESPFDNLMEVKS